MFKQNSLLLEPEVFLYRFQDFPRGGGLFRKFNQITFAKFVHLRIQCDFDFTFQDISNFLRGIVPFKLTDFFLPGIPFKNFEFVQFFFRWFFDIISAIFYQSSCILSNSIISWKRTICKTFTLNAMP